MSLFGGRTQKDDAMARAAQQALVRGVSWHVMPAEFRTGEAARMVAVVEHPVAVPTPVVEVTKPMTVSAEGSTKNGGVPKGRMFSFPGSLKRTFVWVGIAVVAVGGVVAVLVLLPSPESVPVTNVAVVSEEPSVISEPEPNVAPEPVREAPTLAVDTDGDGLTDAEEVLYQSNTALIDTDVDGYSDLREVLNLYNPAGIAPVRLVESGVVLVYTHDTAGYAILYPTSWQVQRTDVTGEVSFIAADGSRVRVLQEENPDRLSAATWFQLRFPTKQDVTLLPVSHDNVEGVMEDGRMAYLTRSVRDGERDRMVIVQYEPAATAPASFESTFKMMVQSFRWTVR